MVDVAEVRALRLLADSGLAPPLRLRPAHRLILPPPCDLIGC